MSYYRPTLTSRVCADCRDLCTKALTEGRLAVANPQNFLYCSILVPVRLSSVKPRVMTSQSSVNFPKIGLKTAQNGEKYSKKQVMRAGFALVV